MTLETHPKIQQQRQYFEHPRDCLLRRCGGEASQRNEHLNNADDSSKSSGSAGEDAKKALSPLLLMALMYTYTVSGAFGVEESVMGGGPLLTIIFILLIPLLVALPISFVVTEMASSIPSNAGFLMWINVTFHPVVFFSMVLMALLFTFIDNALFPVLISEYLCVSMPCTELHTKLLRLALLIFTYILNLVGIHTVGLASIFLTCSTMLPVILMLLVHLLKTGFYLNWPAISNIPSNVDWATFLTTVSWNLCGIEQAGTLAEDIQTPHKTIMRALVPLLGLAYITYIPPILVGVSVTKGLPNFDDWTTGYWSLVAYGIGGNVLRYITIVSSAFSAFGMTMSALCTTTESIAGVAFTGVFPGVIGRVLTQRNERFGTHHWTLTINALITGVFCTLLDFGPLVKMDQVLYAIRVVMVFLSFLVLRYRYPYLHRPFKVPLSGYKLAVFLVPVIFYIALIIITLVGDTETLIMTAGIVGGSVVVSALYCLLVRKDGFHGKVVTVEHLAREMEE